MRLSIAIVCLLLAIWINNGYCQNAPTRPNVPTRPSAQNSQNVPTRPSAQNGPSRPAVPTRPGAAAPTRPAGQNAAPTRPGNSAPTRPGAVPTRPAGQNAAPTRPGLGGPTRPSGQNGPAPPTRTTATTRASNNAPTRPGQGGPTRSVEQPTRPGVTTAASELPTRPSPNTQPPVTIPSRPTETQPPVTTPTTRQTTRPAPNNLPTAPNVTPATVPTQGPTNNPEVGIRDMRCPVVRSVEAIFVSHPRDCSRFFQCGDNGMAYERTCPSGMHFSELRGWCDFVDLAQCTTRVTTINPRPQPTSRPVGIADARCPLVDSATHTVHLPHATDCARFYKCMGGMAFEYNCPAGQHFNVERDWCDWPRLANCQRM